LVDDDDIDPIRDLPNEYTLAYGNGNEIKAYRDGQFNWWKLSLKHGQLPPLYQGHYTTFEECNKAVERLILSQKQLPPAIKGK
jgi:hypothetical protein